MDDIRPPRRSKPAPSYPVRQHRLVAPVPVDHRIASGQPKAQPEEQPALKVPKKKPSGKRWLLGGIVALLLIGLLAIGALFIWYQQQLSPVSNDPQANRIRLSIEPGMTPNEIAALLEDKKLIRSSLAFRVYAKLSKTENNLQAGSYRLAPNESTPQIVKHLTLGKADEFEVTFVPGATLQQNRKVLIEAGYGAEEVDAALAKTYDHPLFESKPATADLEGYIYGETHRFAVGATVETVLRRYFDDYYKVIVDNNLKAGFAQQGLTLYEGITLASIVQRESGGDDKRQIAQVFLLRLEKDISLGSDVTYQYIADKLGVPRDVNLDNPYNTRRYGGLPPGPIATPGDDALKAVANPAPGDYLYFLSGDDDVTYFARTEAEHQENVRRHCQKKCQIL